MELINVNILNIRYRRPGLTKVDFIASYPHFWRRGTVIYDNINQRFLSHGKDVELLLGICRGLQSSNYRKVR